MPVGCKFVQWQGLELSSALSFQMFCSVSITFHNWTNRHERSADLGSEPRTSPRLVSAVSLKSPCWTGYPCMVDRHDLIHLFYMVPDCRKHHYAFFMIVRLAHLLASDAQLQTGGGFVHFAPVIRASSRLPVEGVASRLPF